MEHNAGLAGALGLQDGCPAALAPEEALLDPLPKAVCLLATGVWDAWAAVPRDVQLDAQPERPGGDAEKSVAQGLAALELAVATKPSTGAPSLYLAAASVEEAPYTPGEAQSAARSSAATAFADT